MASFVGVADVDREKFPRDLNSMNCSCIDYISYWDIRKLSFVDVSNSSCNLHCSIKIVVCSPSMPSNLDSNNLSLMVP